MNEWNALHLKPKINTVLNSEQYCHRQTSGANRKQIRRYAKLSSVGWRRYRPSNRSVWVPAAYRVIISQISGPGRQFRAAARVLGGFPRGRCYCMVPTCRGPWRSVRQFDECAGFTGSTCRRRPSRFGCRPPSFVVAEVRRIRRTSARPAATGRAQQRRRRRPAAVGGGPWPWAGPRSLAAALCANKLQYWFKRSAGVGGGGVGAAMVARSTTLIQ